MPQLIPPRLSAKLRPSTQRSWGWVLALILIILALAAVAVLGTVLLTRNDRKPKASQEDQVRSTIQSFDVAIQTGDLTTLRSLTCGNMRDDYVNYNQREWNDTYRRVAAAKQYPVVANIDQVVVNGNHAEANVTAFMAYAPQIRSTAASTCNTATTVEDLRVQLRLTPIQRRINAGSSSIALRLPPAEPTCLRNVSRCRPR